MLPPFRKGGQGGFLFIYCVYGNTSENPPCIPPLKKGGNGSECHCQIRDYFVKIIFLPPSKLVPEFEH